MDKRTNVNRLIGERGLVERAIGEFDPGLVKVGYEDWRAEAEDGQPIDAGEVVVVTGMSGVTLKVRKETG